MVGEGERQSKGMRGVRVRERESEGEEERRE